MFELMSENIEKDYKIKKLNEKIYIAIDHINGEIDKVLPRIYNYNEAKELYIEWGYIIIEIDRKNNVVTEWKE